MGTPDELLGRLTAIVSARTGSPEEMLGPDLDVEAAFTWYQSERTGLGIEFLDELRSAYARIADGPLKYHEIRSGIRRALLRRFPYSVYFVVEEDAIVVLAVLHAHRDPAEGNGAEHSFTDAPSSRVPSLS